MPNVAREGLLCKNCSQFYIEQIPSKISYLLATFVMGFRAKLWELKYWTFFQLRLNRIFILMGAERHSLRLSYSRKLLILSNQNDPYLGAYTPYEGHNPANQSNRKYRGFDPKLEGSHFTFQLYFDKNEGK